MNELIEGIKNKKKRALAKAISMMENQDPKSYEIINGIFHLTGKAHYIGITGNPGAGKSTLINGLIKQFRDQGQTVAILAVDPSSPFTGGAILGDRIRIDDQLLIGEVFFRSIANRSHLGGLSSTTYESLLLLDAFGFDVILIETVGTGQSETAISHIGHTNLVVTVPGLGDDIQTEKAGLLEIADIFVVNKADLPGAVKTRSDLEQMLEVRKSHRTDIWQPPVLMTKAIQMEGIGELVDSIHQHYAYVQQNPRMKNYQQIIKEKTKQMIIRQIEEKFEEFFQDVSGDMEAIYQRKLSHIEFAQLYTRRFMKSLTTKSDE
jgi:LAO/AO transport system kinase